MLSFDAVSVRRKVDKLLQERLRAKAQLRQEKQELADAKKSLEASEQSLSILTDIAKATQQIAHARIASLVSRCLAAVFDDPYTFGIRFVAKRNKTEAEFHYLRGSEEVDPLTAAGGGVADVAAFALRLSSLMLSQPRRRPFLVLDEPFKHVAPENLPRIRDLLLALSSELHVQIVLVTHEPILEIGKVVRL